MTKKWMMQAAVVSAFSLQAVAARAQHSLLPGDVVEPGKYSAELRYDYTRFASDQGTIGADTGKWTENTGVGSAQLSVGLGSGLGMSASLPYVFFDNAQVEASGNTVNRHRQGIGDVSVGGKWQFLRSDAVIASLGLTVKLNTAGKHGGSSTTEFAPSLALTLNRYSSFAPFIVYAPNFVKDSKSPGSQGVIVGSNIGNGPIQAIIMAQARFFGDHA